MSAADIRPTCPKCHGTGRVAEVAPVGGLDEMLAAAEERGRRAGIEERDELRARLWEALSVIESRAPDMTLLIPRIKVVLAPRDSGHDAILCGSNCPGHAATVRK